MRVRLKRVIVMAGVGRGAIGMECRIPIMKQERFEALRNEPAEEKSAAPPVFQHYLHSVDGEEFYIMVGLLEALAGTIRGQSSPKEPNLHLRLWESRLASQYDDLPR
jgi:hypothetical protein